MTGHIFLVFPWDEICICKDEFSRVFVSSSKGGAPMLDSFRKGPTVPIKSFLRDMVRMLPCPNDSLWIFAFIQVEALSDCSPFRLRSPFRLQTSTWPPRNDFKTCDSKETNTGALLSPPPCFHLRPAFTAAHHHVRSRGLPSLHRPAWTDSDPIEPCFKLGNHCAP